MFLTSRVSVKRWAKVIPFSPLSPQQVKTYLRFRGYAIPKNYKTKQETTNEEALREFLEDHPEDNVLPKIVEARHISKGIGYLKDTFVGKDGRFHPLYGFVKTGRLSSKAPNLMNIPQGRRIDQKILAEVAQAIRESLIPSPGMVFGILDWKGIEALLTGYFADDQDYIRLAKLDVHSHLAAHKLGIKVDLSWEDERLMEVYSMIKKKHEQTRHQCKTAIHGTSYGMGPVLLSKEMECSVKDAMEWIRLIATMAPKVAKWRDTQVRKAHKEGMLINPFGYTLQFFEALKRGPDGKVRYGKEAKEAIAFMPQSTAAAMLRETLLTIDSNPLCWDAFNLLIPTHDSITVEMHESKVDIVMAYLKEVMEKPWPELGGMKIQVDSKTGPSLHERNMKSWHAPKLKTSESLRAN